jgi:Reverse transcriptase (RNA-dependent DNA polymerase)
MQRVEQPIMTTGLERIAAKAREDRKLKFTSLAHHVTEELVWESVCHIPTNSAPGCDEQTVTEAKETFKQWAPEMLRAIHQQGYRPPPVLRVFIPKPGKKEKRPLGIPCVADRALQRSVAGVLAAIYEQDFLPCSFGGRPGLGAHHALATLTEVIAGKPVSYVYEADLKNFFGSLDHGWLLRFLENRVGDPRITSLIRRWLKAGILEDGELTTNEKGTPQGGSISVLLSNLYLHHGAPGQTWCFQRVKFPPRQEVQPPHRESSLGSEEATNRTKRRQSDERAVTKVKQNSLVKYLSAGRQHRGGWQAIVGAPQMARWPETAAGSECTARSETEASRDLGDPLRSRSAPRADRVCRTIWLTPEKGGRCSVKSDSLVVLRARESRVQGEAAKQMKTGFRDTSPAPTEAGV